MHNRRTFGYVVDIQDGSCDNTDSPFNLTIVARLLFTSDEKNDRGYIWTRVTAFSSNCLTIAGDPLMEGSVVEGILVATFGDHLTATFGSFVKSSIAEWRQEGAGPPFVAEDRDLDPWSWSPLPVLGGSGFATRKENPRITGARLKPPYLEVHEYHQRKEEMKKEKRDTDPSSNDTKPPKSRSQLAAETYVGLRKAHKEEEKTMARNLRKAERERLSNLAEQQYVIGEKYAQVFREREENIRKFREVKTSSNDESTKPPIDEAEEEEATPEEYPRMLKALSFTPQSHADRIRELISMPDPRRGWGISVIPRMWHTNLR